MVVELRRGHCNLLLVLEYVLTVTWWWQSLSRLHFLRRLHFLSRLHFQSRLQRGGEEGRERTAKEIKIKIVLDEI